MAEDEGPAAPKANAVPAFRRRGSTRAAAGATAGVTGQPSAPGTARPPDDDGRARPLDPASLPMPLSRRRLALIAGALVVAWIVIAFGRQVGDAAAASDRAAQLRQSNAELAAQLAALQSDLGKVQDDQYVSVAARAFDVGARHEIPFALAPDAPTLPPDAPGSAALRLGAPPPASPLEAWLSLLFGSGG